MSDTAPQSPRISNWSIVSGATLQWKIWDDQCVVFNTATGQTHLLDPIPALIVRQIDGGRFDSEALFLRTAEVLGFDLTAERRRAFDEVLRQLDDLGLIEPIIN